MPQPMRRAAARKVQSCVEVLNEAASSARPNIAVPLISLDIRSPPFVS